MKTRLNKDMRKFLDRLARDKVKSPVAEKAYDQAYLVAEKEILRCLAKQYPKREMDVLAKHGFAWNARRFSVTVLSEDPNGIIRQDGFNLREERFNDHRKLPRMPGTHYTTSRVNLDVAASKAWNDHANASAARENARQELLNQFLKVINHGKYLEDVEDVWPAAREARRFVPVLPVVVLADAFEAIRDAVEQKLA